jgi:hypothetical protein
MWLMYVWLRLPAIEAVFAHEARLVAWQGSRLVLTFYLTCERKLSRFADSFEMSA